MRAIPVGLIAILVGCVPAAETTTTLERGLTLAEVFETDQPYSARALDTLALGGFLAAHPHYRADSAAIADFYVRRAMQFAWVVGDSLSASAETFIALTGMIEGTAPAPGPGPSEIEALLEGARSLAQRVPLCQGCAVEAELMLTAEFLGFADRNYNGYFGRDLSDLNWFIPRAKKDPSRLVDSLAIGGTDLSAYEPVHPQYGQLKAQVSRFYDLAEIPWPPLELPEGVRALRVGDRAEVVGDIRQRLRLLGDLDEGRPGELVDSALVRGILRFQERHGLRPDGVVGANFLGSINTPPATRLRTMLVNMERLRWVPERPPPDLLLVNIPEFVLHVYEDGREVMNMEVVVGAHATRTVIFSDSVSEVVFSPTWTVPASITRNEILPALARDPDYLRDRNMEIVGGSASLPVIRQSPGPGNALGRVKFVFPNSYSIYLHDTPARSLFSAEFRALSHGCIRLSRPRDLAEYLLRDDAAWPPDRIARAMEGGRETFVPLGRRIPVVIVYFTAWVDPEGRLNFRDDVYGHDERLAEELFEAGGAT